MNSARMNIWIRTVTIVAVLLFVAVVFVLKSDAVGFTFATGSGQGGLELKIDSKTYYNGALQPKLTWKLKDLVPGTDRFFNFLDVKPGDRGTSTVSIHINKNPAWVCLDFLNLKDKENGNNEPESHEDANGAAGGELSSALEFFAWFDDGDNKYEMGEKALFGTTTQKATSTLRGTSYAIADYTHGPAIASGQTKYVGITWCAGNLTVNTATANVQCDGEVLGNGVQTDSMTVDVSFRAVSQSSQPKFVCDKPPLIVNKCEIEGHKFDKDGKPLANWSIGLGKNITHSNGIDTYDLATSTTDVNGYYCLRWDGNKRTLRPGTTKTYVSGSYNFTYHVFEVLKDGWKNVSVTKGATASTTVSVPSGDIAISGKYVSVQMGVQNGYIYGNAAYHIDFYNATTTPAPLSQFKKKGNNGHGNDPDHNDNSNPGKSNSVVDTTDADGVPGKSGQTKDPLPLATWTVKETKSNSISSIIKTMTQKLSVLGKKP